MHMPPMTLVTSRQEGFENSSSVQEKIHTPSSGALTVCPGLLTQPFDSLATVRAERVVAIQ
jgi:hypothetical protein